MEPRERSTTRTSGGDAEPPTLQSVFGVRFEGGRAAATRLATASYLVQQVFGSPFEAKGTR